MHYIIDECDEKTDDNQRLLTVGKELKKYLRAKLIAKSVEENQVRSVIVVL